jgi:hypothetical protein
MTPPDPLATKLHQLRRHLARGVIVRGVGRVLVWIIGFALVDALLDRMFVMDRAQRAVMLLLGLAGAAVIAYRHLWRPMQQPPTDEALCWEVEQRQPQLQQRLLAAWQLARVPSSTASPVLVQAVIAEGRAAASTANFSTVLDGRRWLRNMTVVVLGAAILLGAVAAGFATNWSASGSAAICC